MASCREDNQLAGLGLNLNALLVCRVKRLAMTTAGSTAAANVNSGELPRLGVFIASNFLVHQAVNSCCYVLFSLII